MFKKSEVVSVHNEYLRAEHEKAVEKERVRQAELSRVRDILREHITGALATRTYAAYNIIVVNGQMSATTDVSVRASNAILYPYACNHLDDQARLILGAEIAKLGEWEECSIHTSHETDHEITLTIAFSGKV